MYLYKNMKSSKDDNNLNRQDFRRYFKIFSPTKFLHQNKLDFFKSLETNQIENFADLIASLFVNLFIESGNLRSSLISEAIRCCRDILMDCGYDETSIRSINEVLGNERTKNIILTAGCQTEELLDSRVNGAVEICEELVTLNRDIKIVFSGKNHKTGRVKIKDESQRMELLFWEKILRSRLANMKKLVHIEKIILERESGKTQENVEKFLDILSKQIDGDIPINLYIVSSNFHLYRLSVEIESRLKEAKFNIENLVLIGSENINTLNQVTKNPAYIKTMFFEVYRYLANSNEFWTIDAILRNDLIGND